MFLICGNDQEPEQTPERDAYKVRLKRLASAIQLAGAEGQSETGGLKTPISTQKPKTTKKQPRKTEKDGHVASEMDGLVTPIDTAITE